MKLKSYLSAVKTSFLFASLAMLNSAASAVELPPGTKLSPQQVLGYGLASTPETLDPGINVDWNSQQLLKSLFDTLVRQDNTGAIVGAAAESWETSDDHLTWIFHLRKNATWTDGVPVTAHDFVYAWQRVLDPNTASLGSDYLTSTQLKNAKEVRDGKLPPSSLGVSAVDDFTLKLELDTPIPWLLDTLTFLNTAPVRKDIVEKYGSTWTRADHMVSNGPFKLQEIKFNERITFTKREDYWDAKNIYIKEINYYVSNDPNASYLAYLTNRYFTARIPSQYLEIVKKERPHEIIREPYPSTYAVILNTRLAKLQDVRVRQAISLLIDRHTLSNKVYKAFQPTTLVAPSMLADGQLEQEDAFLLDPSKKAEREQKARELLRQAGYTKENPLKLVWTYNRGRNAERNNVALVGMLNSFSDGLLQVELKALDKNTYLYNVAHADFEMVYYIVNPDYYHVSSFFNIFNPNNANNFSGWEDKHFQDLYQQALHNPDAKARQEIYQELNKILQQQVPIVPLVLSERFILRSPALGGFNGKLPFTYLRDYYLLDNTKVAPTGN